MKKAVLLSSVAIVSLAGFVVVKVPASIVWQQLLEQNLVPQELTLEGLEGTLWFGSADKVFWEGSRLPGLQWNFSGFSPVSLSAGYNVQLGHARTDISAKGYLEAGPDYLEVLNLSSRMTLEQLQTWLDIPLPMAVNGQARLSINELRLAGKSCESLDGSGRLSDVVVDSVWGELDLGASNFSLDCSGQQMTAKLDQKSDHIVSSLTFGLTNLQNYTLDGRLEPQPDLGKPYREGLGYIGDSDSRGGYQVSWQGSL
ncbi:type II secretion system protein N [Sansalvadorimonas sp. 2012CJ34-2]|uniref:Type II secretion system protein N n=1 Tax=Parendozoicomonas callyspongiae TaxID=2942213 RepID=A0ABT0PBU1_9GAMM|nr:type II secretion system protein N [Sansalvadorimonas sp. 2012CJ34-2]MCL6268748.1 type II secretion system protein N [Sansalvadorimonas sp. 2012CJ34-2]